jgi:twinkle protein
VLDPLNCVDHLIPRGESETQYMNKFLNQLINFARRNRCLVILVAHPRKMNREPGSNRTTVPDMYDISGSAAFFNKCDYGMVVERKRESQVTRIHVEKVKFRHLGDKGTASFTYNIANGRFNECEEKPTLSAEGIMFNPLPFDNSNWLPNESESPELFDQP